MIAAILIVLALLLVLIVARSLATPITIAIVVVLLWNWFHGTALGTEPTHPADFYHSRSDRDVIGCRFLGVAEIADKLTSMPPAKMNRLMTEGGCNVTLPKVKWQFVNYFGKTVLMSLDMKQDGLLYRYFLWDDMVDGAGNRVPTDQFIPNGAYVPSR
jgi:hypothetical protein